MEHTSHTVIVQIGRTEIPYDMLRNKKRYKSVASGVANYEALQINKPFHIHYGSERIKAKSGDYVCLEYSTGVIFSMPKKQFENAFVEAE